MATCTNCGHSLLGLPGAPTEATGVFTADVRCPECGAAYRAGARILVGGSTAFAMTRARPLHQRALLSLVLGSGIATVVVHIMAVGALWFVISALIDLAAGGKRFISAQLIILWILSLAAIYGVVRFWWARRPALHDHARRADERDRWLVIGPDGVEARKERLEPWQIRTFRVYECLAAGDGTIVASIRPIPMREIGWAKLSDEVHMAIAPGSAAALADALVGTVRGRQSCTTEIGDEIDGDLALPNFKRSWAAPVGVMIAPFALGFGLWLTDVLGDGIGLLMAIAPPAGLCLLAVEKRGEPMVRWRLSDRGFTEAKLAQPLAGSSSPGGKPAAVGGHAWRSDQLACLELRESHGVPYLVLRFRRWWNGSARIVPGDWLGMAPAVFAAKVAERLGVPLRNRIRA